MCALTCQLKNALIDCGDLVADFELVVPPELSIRRILEVGFFSDAAVYRLAMNDGCVPAALGPRRVSLEYVRARDRPISEEKRFEVADTVMAFEDNDAFCVSGSDGHTFALEYELQDLDSISALGFFVRALDQNNAFIEVQSAAAVERE